MQEWGRNTPWRQGHILPSEAVRDLGLACAEPQEDCVIVVISHDCDLAQSIDVEPNVETIVGRLVNNRGIHGTYTHAKNARKLHVQCSRGEEVCVIELEASSRLPIRKECDDGPSLADYLPSSTRMMTVGERNILQIWLAARYRRSAFPDEFDRRLSKQTGVAERLTRAFKESGKHVVAVFFDVDEGEERDHHGADDTYALWVTLLYSTQHDPSVAQAAAGEAAEKIKDIFASRCRCKRDNGQVWQWIELVGVDVVADEALSFAQAQRLRKWQADYISLRADPEQPLA